MEMKIEWEDSEIMHYPRGFVYLFAATLTISPPVKLMASPEQYKSHPEMLLKIPSLDQTQFIALASDQGISPSKLVGYVVENQIGQKLGSVKDLIIDTRNGWLAFVVVSSGGLAGLGSKWRAVPPIALSPATAFYRTLAMDITLDRWRSAPTFSKGQIARLNDPVQLRRIYQYYDQKWPALPPAAETDTSFPADDPNPRKTDGLRFASELIQKQVVNAQDREVGRIVDLLVNLKSPNITFVILKPKPFITSADQTINDKLFAVPLYAITTSKKLKKLILDVSVSEFQRAPPLTAEDWKRTAPGIGSPRIFRYQTSDANSANATRMYPAGLNRTFSSKHQLKDAPWKI